MAQEPLSAPDLRREIREHAATRLISEPLKSKIDFDLSQPNPPPKARCRLRQRSTKSSSK